jgi:hypothetical protein
MELEEANSKLQDTVYLLQQQVSDLQRRLDGRQTGGEGSARDESTSSESQQHHETADEGDGQQQEGTELEGTSKLEGEQQPHHALGEQSSPVLEASAEGS